MCSKENSIIELIDVGYTGILNPSWKRHMNKIGYILSFNPLYKSFSFKKHCHLQLAVSDISGIRNFNILKKNSCSSLFNPDKSILPYRKQNLSDLDVKQIIPVNCTRLDEILDSLEPTFNFLKTDAQGSDLAVIKSLGEHIKHIWCIQTEVFFKRFYHNTPMAIDICKYVMDHNFYLLGDAHKRNNLFGDFVFISNDAPEEFTDIVGKIYKCMIS